MAKHVILVLEYDMGDYSEAEEEGQQIPTDPEDIGLHESFYQSDANINHMRIVGVRIEEK